jgi:hypothetical protein
MLAISAARAGKTASPFTEGARSLEVRWIFPGQMETAVAEWFGRFPAESQSREDTYLVDPQLRGLSVKVRGGAALELKVYYGSLGILDLVRRARGRMEFWRKWSWPMSPLHLDIGDLAGWLYEPGATTQYSPGPGEASRRSR